MAPGPEHEPESLWASSADEGTDNDSFGSLDLAEAATAPAHLEEPSSSFKADDTPEGPAPEAPDGGEAAPSTMATVRRRGRGGRPRVTAEQDQKILETFEKAKAEGRSLKEAAQQLANELGQPAEYINQRYYYLQRRQGTASPPAQEPARTARRVRAAAAAAAAAPQGRRRARGGARETAPGAPSGPTDLTGVEQRLAELSDIATRQLGALTERIERIEERLRSLEQAPRRSAAAGDEELYSRLGRVLVRAAFGALEQGR